MSAVFHQAVLEGDVTKVRFLLKYSPGIRINHASKHGLTALQQAAWDGHVDLVNFLLEQGADLSLVDSNGYTALHLASQSGHLDVVSLLVNSACVNVHAKTDRGQMAVDLARTEPVRALLSQAMLEENFKRKCNVGHSDPWETSEPSYYKNLPGCRYSLSSGSTDSGVYDDSNLLHDNSETTRQPRSQRLARENSYESYTSRSTTSDYSTGSEGRDPRPVYRKTDGSAVTSILKSQSFSGIHQAYDGERMGLKGSRPARCSSTSLQTQREERDRHRRPQSAKPREPNRRRTVTFGESDHDTRQKSYQESVPESQVRAPSPQYSTPRSRIPPPIPPRISSSLSPRKVEDSASRPTLCTAKYSFTNGRY
ncbi:ankyrin repeat domain-containing protein 50 [Nematostella vectensis]|uniref:ankyrin repeat domain-containing protein 50 n=1 Tax=Nematostella vectensis TaxID=45351 RepID=UPI0020774D61|nr:ankyrin repeat domain-containing protein 50 [Nematostella vectensis]XP_048581256.1 ankyrin repeat domain-containing protein 50 [Nematostella vectensis]